jgi:hypothetical protein
LPTTEGTWRDAAGPGIWRSFSVASTFVVLTLGIFLVARRTTGDVISPLPLTLLIPSAAILVAWGWLVRFGEGGPRASFFSFWMPLSTIVLFAIGLSYPGARVADWFVWSTACAALILGPRWLDKTRHGLPAIPRRRRSNRLIQDLKRYRSDDGRESVLGMLAAEFPPGLRNQTIWVGFCPPFEFLPQVTAHAIGDPSASVKVAQVLHNGAQLEVRLPHSISCQQVANIEISAAEPNPL